MFTRIGRQIDRLRFGGNSPSAFIVGAQKAGTSSLFRYLDLFPHLTGAQSKEVGFFDKEYRFERGVEWYERQFVHRGRDPQTFFEATPEYLYRRKVAPRIHDYNPNSKIIILLREPVSRAYSAWNMYRQFSELGRHPRVLDRHYDNIDEVNPLYATFLQAKSPPTFHDYLDLEFELIDKDDPREEPGLIRRGLYLPQIERYVNLFGTENILILGSEELRSSTAETVNKAAFFLTGTDFRLSSESFNTQFHKRQYKTQIPDDCRKRLDEFYRPHNEQLWSYLGETLRW